MSRHRPRVMALPDLATALDKHAAGIDAHHAAVNLIVSHGVFLARPEFEREFVRVARCHPTCAYIRWGAAVTALNQHRLPCSSSEAAVLRVAASLGGDVPVRLRRVLGGLDDRNLLRITDAVTLANGTQPHRCF
jgi:hypothetical protein